MMTGGTMLGNPPPPMHPTGISEAPVVHREAVVRPQVPGFAHGAEGVDQNPRSSRILWSQEEVCKMMHVFILYIYIYINMIAKSNLLPVNGSKQFPHRFNIAKVPNSSQFGHVSAIFPAQNQHARCSTAPSFDVIDQGSSPLVCRSGPRF